MPGGVAQQRALVAREGEDLLEPRGELYAAMLDTKAGWDDLVLRHAPDEETAYRILENRLYTNVTSRFVQSHDYIAMERLFDLHASGKYDLIIIDTPPTRNAIDFVDAPARMAEFFGGKLLRWLTMPYRVGGKRGARLVNFASKPFYTMADRVLGSQFLQVEYPFLRYNLFFYVCVLSFYARARSDPRFRAALSALDAKRDKAGRLVVARPPPSPKGPWIWASALPAPCASRWRRSAAVRAAWASGAPWASQPSRLGLTL